MARTWPKLLMPLSGRLLIKRQCNLVWGETCAFRINDNDWISRRHYFIQIPFLAPKEEYFQKSRCVDQSLYGITWCPLNRCLDDRCMGWVTYDISQFDQELDLWHSWQVSDKTDHLIQVLSGKSLSSRLGKMENETNCTAYDSGWVTSLCFLWLKFFL